VKISSWAIVSSAASSITIEDVDRELLTNWSDKETSKVQSYYFKDNEITYTLIDTPGFDDTYLSDQAVTDKILSWLDSFYQRGLKLNGIIYLHSIATPKLQGSAFRNLRMFRQLCGKDAMKGVILGTTFWDSVDLSIGEQRERELIEEDRFWGKMIKLGSQVLRLGLDRASALAMLRGSTGYAEVKLEAQREKTEEPTKEDSRLSNHQQQRTDGADASGYHPEKGEWYMNNMQKHQDQMKKWEHDREELMRQHASKSALLEKTRSEVASSKQSRQYERQKQWSHIYKSHGCRCKLIGRPTCASCGKLITNVGTGKVFYRKRCRYDLYVASLTWRTDCCFCHHQTFLHCIKCGKRCPEEEHPDMNRMTTYCIVM
jgi:hypothetical protein